MPPIAELPATPLRHIGKSRVRGRLIDRIVRERLYRSAYQPIVDLSTRRIEGFECLTRFDAASGKTPDTWFLAAAEAGLGERLEADTIGCAVRALRVLPGEMYLSVNASASSVLNGDVLRIFEKIDPSRIILEITEHHPVEDYRALNEALNRLRASGLRIAVDDVGAGYADLQHLIHLRPDVVKLDMSLTRRMIDCDATRAMMIGIVGFAHTIGSRVIAEGIETPAQLHALEAIRVDAGQGYLLGAPIAAGR